MLESNRSIWGQPRESASGQRAGAGQRALSIRLKALFCPKGSGEPPKEGAPWIWKLTLAGVCRGSERETLKAGRPLQGRCCSGPGDVL